MSRSSSPACLPGRPAGDAGCDQKTKGGTMRVLVAGASGAIGTRLVAQLIDAGHEVIGTSRSPGNAARVQALGAKAVVLDLLDPRAVGEAVRKIEPEAILHEATALADVSFSKNLD